jgi:hypothetical protein
MTDEKKRRSKHQHHHLHLSWKLVFPAVFLACAGVLIWYYVDSGRLDERLREKSLEPLDIKSIANSDYHLNAAAARPLKTSKALYPDIVGGMVKWGPVPFRIIRPNIIGGPRWNVYTSCGEEKRTVEVPLIEKPSKALYLLADGCNITSTGSKPVADLTIHYTNGSWEKKTLYSIRDVWMYDEEKQGLFIAPDRLAWKAGGDQSLSGIFVPLDPRKTPERLTIETLSDPDGPGLILFAVTQEKKHWPF